MNRLHRPRMRRGVIATLTGGLTLLALSTIAPMSAQAAACTQTIRGTHAGVINVPANQKVCLVNAIQGAAVNVAFDGALSSRNSTVKGAITLEQGFKEFEFCTSKTMGGAISAKGGKGAVLIGGSGLLGALTCGANNIDGAVTLDRNTGGVKLARSAISGAVTASGNLNGTVISGNAIGGALGCSDNVPAPTNAGATNTAVGGKSGQCAAPAF
jgi:hypothetical protein